MSTRRRRPRLAQIVAVVAFAAAGALALAPGWSAADSTDPAPVATAPSGATDPPPVAAPPSGATEPTPSTDPTPTGTDPTSTTAPDPTTSTDPTTATSPDPTTSTDPTATPDPTSDDPDPTSTTDPDPTSTTDPGPTSTTSPNQADQTANVVTAGTSLANTGANTAIASSTTGSTDSSDPASDTTTSTPDSSNGSANGDVQTGTAGADGSQDTSTISQTAAANATDAATIQIIQNALVVNIGIGLAGSGLNTVGAQTASGGGSGAGSTRADITTGNADATGTDVRNAVLQSATITASIVAGQVVAVLNLGVGIANSGLNTATAAASDASPDGGTGASGTSDARTRTGDAHATGNASDTGIAQSATAQASQRASLTIVQQAIVFNIGIALANSGANTAGAVTGQQAAVINAVMAQIFEALGAPVAASPPAVGPGEPPASTTPPDTPDSTAGDPQGPQDTQPAAPGAETASGVASAGTPLPGGAASAVSTGSGAAASIQTGHAGAIGNKAVTRLTQQVTAALTGDDSATLTQTAWIGNAGIALANSGANGAQAESGAALDPDTDASVKQAIAVIKGFLALMAQPGGGPGGTQALDEAMSYGDSFLSAHGAFTSTDAIKALGSDVDTQVVPVQIHQRSGVLNLAIAVADSGHNQVAVLVGTPPEPGTGQAGPPTVLGTAVIRTGSARATGNHATVTVCQIIGTVKPACPQAETPTTTSAPPTSSTSPSTSSTSPSTSSTSPSTSSTAPPVTSSTIPTEVLGTTTTNGPAESGPIQPQRAAPVQELAYTGRPLDSETRGSLLVLCLGLGLVALAKTPSSGRRRRPARAASRPSRGSARPAPGADRLVARRRVRRPPIPARTARSTE